MFAKFIGKRFFVKKLKSSFNISPYINFIDSNEKSFLKPEYVTLYE